MVRIWGPTLPILKQLRLPPNIAANLFAGVVLMLTRIILALLVLAGFAWAQNTPTIGVLPDNGPSLPATCVIGQIYFRTAVTPGLNQCNPANTWTALATSAGSGTVTNTLGALTLNSVILGNAGNDVKVATGFTTDGVSQLSLGAAGGSNGILGLNGSTSGTATFTAPAVAGGTTNPVLSTNALQITGAQIASFCVGANNNCFGGATTTALNLNPGGTNATFIDANRFLTQAGQWFWPNARNLVFAASNFTTAANTNLQTITGLSFTIAAFANNFEFHCALAYSQATATAAVSFGIQAATNAPTNIFAIGNQQITVGPPATYVAGVLPTLNTTTATTIVSGTPGAITTNYIVNLDGTMELAATTNTINIMVSTAASGDAVTVLRGSYCMAF